MRGAVLDAPRYVRFEERDLPKMIKPTVTFEPVDGPIYDRIDDAYRANYSCSPFLSPMIQVRALFATVKVMPRETKAQ